MIQRFYWVLKWCGWYLKNIEEYNPNKTCKVSIVFNDMTVDMLSNKKKKQIKYFSCFH